MNLRKTGAILEAVLLLAAIGYGRQETGSSRGEILQRAMDAYLKDSGLVGVSAAVIFPDGTMWKGATGISHPGVPLTTDMLFDIASVAKQFQAVLALKLAEEGAMALDDPLEKWFPPYPQVDGKITIRQLLSMTSGIDDFVADPKSPWGAGYQNIEFEKIWTLDEILGLVGEPNFNPGEASSYSNTNYVVLKHVIEKAARTKQTILCEERLLKPYRLDHTLVDFSKPVPANRPIAHGWLDARGDGNLVDVSGHSLNWAISIAPMLVYSTPADLVKWVDALFHKKTVLSEESLKAMLTFSGPVRGEPLMKGYGLGVADINVGALLPKWEGLRCYGHLGNQIGYSTFAAYFPDHGLSLAMTFSRGCDQDADRAAGAFAAGVFDALFEDLGLGGSEPPRSAQAPAAENAKVGLTSIAPEDAGWSSQKLGEAKAFAAKINSAAVMVLYDGQIFVSWGNVEKKYRLHSIRKPLLSALYGIYWGRGKVRLDATLEELGIDDIPPGLTKEEKQAKVSDLLQSCSGVYHEAAAETREMAGVRPARGSHPPGAFYYYNNWDFNALGTIFEKMTGAKIFEAFKKEIADPIGMEDFSLDDCGYSYEENKSRHPAYNFRMSARDLARLGVLYQKNGSWNGKQIIPRDWIEISTAAQATVSEERGVGYGYMWNVIKPGMTFSNMIFDGHGGFFHTGVGIHALAVLPDAKLVYVYRYDTDGEFQDPGDATIQLAAMIMKARL